MPDNAFQIEDAAASLLSSLDTKIVDRPTIEAKVRAIAAIQGVVSEDQIREIARKLEERFSVSMDLGTLFASNDYRPWLDDERGNIEWYYWDRYKRYLIDQKYSPQVIRSLDDITDQIIDHLENPRKTGKWARKGMVVGYVQSGKTSNYTGLMNKAADSGYRVIIVLGGMLNALRNQTQARLDSGFVGKDSKEKVVVGVGKFSWERSPAYFTTSEQDFRKAFANQIGVAISNLKEPALLVVKKNKTTLGNLIDWFRHNNPHNLKDQPLLLIDDEADHGSINTSKDGDEATAINKKIRELLHLFDRSSYVGYTATPFANVFIDPETDSEMLGDDLFPRDFIISLDPPSNYIGPDRIFSSNSDLDLIREIDDYEDDLPPKHKKEWRPQSLPSSLREAIEVFILVRAIRLAKGQKEAHNSMLVNVSRFTAVQSNVKLLIDEYVKATRQAIVNYYKLDDIESPQSGVIARFKHIFEGEFTGCGFAWQDIRSLLKSAVTPISVVEVNSSSSAEPLDYTRQNYPNGRNVIAVGGMNLSRGLTLEGLTVSYFLRNSVMYDTLMQMGRWFGYRDGYAELCRIYMTAETASWYGHISDAMDELRDEFRRMKAAGMSPQDFGLCVRSHPEALIVTARNKMRTGIPVLREVSLEGRLVETSVLLRSPEIVRQNLNTLEAMVRDALDLGSRIPFGQGALWQGVPSQYVVRFIERFRNHPASQITEAHPLKEYIRWLSEEGSDSWDVVLVTPKMAQTDVQLTISGIRANAQKRKVSEYPETGGLGIAVSNRRVASRGLEMAGLSEEEVSSAESQYDGTNIPDHLYRSVRKRPLLMLHLLDCRLGGQGPKLFADGIAAYGISFPGEAGSRKPQKLVEYVVNTVWWRNEYIDLSDDDLLDED